MKNYRKPEYLTNSSILKYLESYYKRPLRTDEVFKVLRNLEVLDFFFVHENMTHEDLATHFSISSSSVGRYLNNEMILKNFYIEDAEIRIKEIFQDNTEKGNKKKPNYIKDEEILKTVEAYLKEGATLSTVAKDFNISKYAVSRRLNNIRTKELLTKETFTILKTKLDNQSLPKKHLEKQRLFVEKKEESHTMGENTPLLAKQAEVQTRTAKESLKRPRMTREEAIRYQIEKRVEHFADLFILSHESYSNTCKKYDCEPFELATLFSEILSLTNMEKYQLLLMKYPYLNEYEESRIFEPKMIK